MSGLGVSIGARTANAARGTPESSPGFGRAKSVLMIYASGGQSQLDMWDPKPDAPVEVRGAFGTISTAVPGTQFCEHLPLTARVADRFTVVRSMSHEDVDHGSATYLALTGHYHTRRSGNPPPTPFDLPTAGAVVKRMRPTQRHPYSAVHLNGPALVPILPAPGQNAGCLGARFDPLVLGDVTDPGAALDGLDSLSGLPKSRIDSRKALLSQIDASSVASGSSEPRRLASYYEQAYRLLESPQTQRAFDLSQEPDAIRDRYGRNRSGQACLLARRLAEAEVPWINVIWSPSNRGQDLAPDDTDQYGWDTHNDIFDALKGRLLPRFDQAFSALIEDLDRRGLLEQTLVVCMGEFGRAPLVALEPRFAGATPGRKHWAAAYSIVMAGAGVARGAVYGASDRHGAYVRSNPVGPWDVTATMYSALGIDPSQELRDRTDRPFALSTGRPVAGLYS
ncbi:MAG TPA: DUF1501 domain-containing protein [Caulifigura sp.]|nr:DUF1501 domain-containing protein [Caulifigura sp.]